MEKGKVKRRLRNEKHNISSSRGHCLCNGCCSLLQQCWMMSVLFGRRTDDRERQSEGLKWRWKTADVHLRPEFSPLQTFFSSPCLDCSISTSSAQTIYHRNTVVRRNINITRRNITRVPIHRSRCKPDAPAATLNGTATILGNKTLRLTAV